jgi:hypothetical protein
MAEASAPLGAPPPPCPAGARLVQKMEWFTWPPPLNLMAVGRCVLV